MKLLPPVARLIPPRCVRWLGQLQFVAPWTAPMLYACSRSLRNGESTVRHGVAKGLRFDPHGGNPGYALGTSEPDEQAFLAQHLRAGDVFFDIGANVGFFAVLGARLVGDGGRVFAFEPFPDSAAAIRRNAAVNQFAQVTVIEAAVSDHSGRGSLAVSGTSTQFRLETTADAHRGQAIPIEIIAVDDLLAARELPPPTVVMIDVEGAEVDVLRGMARTIRDFRPVIVCEVHWLGEQFHKACAEVVVPAGYSIRRLDGAPLTAARERYHVIMLPI